MIYQAPQSNDFEVECDYCGEVVAVTAADWDAMLEEVKKVGWLIKKIQGVWEHFCPACVGAGNHLRTGAE